MPDAVSLFSNCGAGDIGFATAGFRFRIMAELVESRLDVALRNHKDAEGVVGDLRVTWPSVVNLWRLRYGSTAPDLVAACPPCQGMSSARSDRGFESDPEAGSKDPRNLLVLPIAHIATSLTPTFVVVENVTAFLSRLVKDPHSGDAVSAARLLTRLLADKYAVYPFLTDLVDFGVPQTRKRSFLTFVRRDSNALRILRKRRQAPYPVPTNAADYGGQPITLDVALKKLALSSLDASSPTLARDPDYALHFVPVWAPRQYRMVAAIPSGYGASAWENDQCEICGSVDTDTETVVCPNCGEPLLRPVVAESDRTRLVHGFRRGSYRRMNPSRPAATVTTASGRIGGSRTIHPSENRVMSPYECALLQTIPPSFDWGDSLSKRGVCELRAMIGEAVPPQFTRVHGEVLGALLGTDEPSPSFIDERDQRCECARRRLKAR